MLGGFSAMQQSWRVTYVPIRDPGKFLGPPCWA